MGDELRRIPVSRALLVTDQRLRDNGTIDSFEQHLKRDGIATAVFADVQPDPTDQNVWAGLECLQACGAEAIIAIGGGSVIDAAKGIGVASTNSQPLSTFLGYDKIPNRGLPLVVIPTTAGTGSEVTQVAVITDTARHIKMMMRDRNLMPRTAIIDYELSMTMPATLTAHVGVDTLVHGIEAFVSKRASGLTDPLARSCVGLTARHLLTAYEQPDNRAAREGMALAASHGGMAFSNSSVCLVHGMSRPIGAVFHLPHGLSNALLLNTVTRFSIPGAPERYAAISHEMGFCEHGTSDQEACEKLIDGVGKLTAELGIPKLRDALKADRSVFESHLRKMAEDALASGSPQNNPVVPSLDEIIELYRQTW